MAQLAPYAVPGAAKGRAQDDESCQSQEHTKGEGASDPKPRDLMSGYDLKELVQGSGREKAPGGRVHGAGPKGDPAADKQESGGSQL